MKLQDSDIISAARDLRDEQNEQLNVAPNPLKGRRTSTPLWWAAVAAALVVGFFLGRQTLSSLPRNGESLAISEQSSPTRSLSLESSAQPHPSITGGAGGGASVIYEVVHDTIYETRIVRVPTPSQQIPTAQAEPDPSPGCSMLCDDIRYDLLAGN